MKNYKIMHFWLREREKTCYQRATGSEGVHKTSHGNGVEIALKM
jgi:hypothetical protein